MNNIIDNLEDLLMQIRQLTFSKDLKLTITTNKSVMDRVNAEFQSKISANPIIVGNTNVTEVRFSNFQIPGVGEVKFKEHE